ncbi:hypothetical protein Plhal304r1_c004g0014611 [Plasmopara halstedii]
MKIAFGQFEVCLSGSKPFLIYTDFAPVHTETSSPHLSLRMAKNFRFAQSTFDIRTKPDHLLWWVLFSYSPTINSAYHDVDLANC